MFQLCFNIGKGADFNQDMTRVGPIMRWGGELRESVPDPAPIVCNCPQTTKNKNGYANI